MTGLQLARPQQVLEGVPCVQSNSLTQRPTPNPGTSTTPLLSGAADGIHVSQAYSG